MAGSRLKMFLKCSNLTYNTSMFRHNAPGTADFSKRLVGFISNLKIFFRLFLKRKLKKFIK